MTFGLAFGYALLLWWFSTGLILFLDGLPRRTFRWSMAAATLVLALALYGLVQTRGDASPAGAYGAFTCALLVWAWHEISFLMGYVTGPRTTPCPAGSAGWSRVAHAIEAILYHELAILVSGAAILALTWDGANQVGLWTFLILWGMRLSAKLNVFLGVPNTAEEFLPEHLRYIASFFRKRPMNLFFPVAATVSTAIAALLVAGALAADATPFEATGYALLAALMILAVVEHWFLILPLPAIALWRWSLRSRDPGPVIRIPLLAGLLAGLRPTQVSTEISSTVRRRP